MLAGHDSCSAASNGVEDGCGPENPPYCCQLEGSLIVFFACVFVVD